MQAKQTPLKSLELIYIARGTDLPLYMASSPNIEFDGCYSDLKSLGRKIYNKHPLEVGVHFRIDGTLLFAIAQTIIEYECAIFP